MKKLFRKLYGKLFRKETSGKKKTIDWDSDGSVKIAPESLIGRAGPTITMIGNVRITWTD